MKAVLYRAVHGGKRILRPCGSRFLLLVLVLSLTVGTVLGVPVAATEDEAEIAETASILPAVPASVDVNIAKLLQSNLQALSCATVQTTAVYSGEPLALCSVSVEADEKKQVVCLEAGSTVSAAVAASGITLGEADYLNLPADSFVQDGMAVTVTRVAYTDRTKTFAVAYTTEVKYTGELRQGATKVGQKGVNGVRTVVYRDRLENGKVISTEVISDKVTTAPVKKIILKGTKVGTVVSEPPTAIPLDSAGQPLKFKKLLTGMATAYTSDRGDSGTHTATGSRAQVGVVAVDPRKIPFGTKLWIVSRDGKVVYGYAVAGDTGGTVKSGKVLVDLYYDTYGECSRFGRRTMNVYIL